MITSRPLTALMALTIAGGVTATIQAQGTCNLPDQTVAARTPSGVDAGAVRACVDANVPGLSGDYDAIRQARQNLLTPLRSQNVSIFFRLAYSDQLKPAITPLIANASDDIAINAVRIAGELGTIDGANLCVAALDDKRPALRMMAAAGLARTFTVLRETPTIQPGPFSGIETRLAAALAKEKDTEVIDGIAIAYDAALQIPTSVVADAQNIALRSAATEFGKITRQQSLNPATLPALLRASKSMLDTLTAVAGTKPQNDALREAAGFGGDLLAYTLRRLRAGEVSATDRQQLALLIGQAQNMVSVSGTLLGQSPKAYRLNTLVAEGNDRQYFRDVMNLIGAEGDLIKAPFNLRRDRFIPAP